MTINVNDKDAIWATCALLKGTYLGRIHTASPEECWPMKSDAPMPLDWIQLQDGVHTIWRLVHPLRPESDFHGLATAVIGRLWKPKTPMIRPHNIPPQMVELFELDGSLPELNNPYYLPVHNIASQLELKCSSESIFLFFEFSGQLSAEFKCLLCCKDPRALLLLAYWYATVCCAGPWFIRRRATVECKSICMYLERNHPEQKAVQDLLSFPKRQCGLEL